MLMIIPRAAVYIRVSTGHQEDKYGLAYQERLTKKLISDKSWCFTKVYEDRGISGTKGPDIRHGLRYLLDDAKNNLFDIVVVYNLDRLSRSKDLTYTMLDILKSDKIEIVSCTEDLSNELEMSINYSEKELKTIKARLAMGREQKRIETGYIGGKLPYGYFIVDNNIEINLDHAHVVRSIYHAYHTKKISLRQISILLSDEKIKSPLGKNDWNKTTIGIILDNKDKYEGGIINDNENGIRWPKILTEKYPTRIKRK